MHKIFYTTNPFQNITRSFGSSFIIHTAVILFFLLLGFHQSPLPMIDKQELIHIELSTIPNIQESLSKPMPKSLQKIAPVVESKVITSKPLIQEVKNIITTQEEIPQIIQAPKAIREEQIKEVPLEKIEKIEAKPTPMVVSAPQTIKKIEEIKPQEFKTTPVIYDASTLNNPAPSYPTLSKRLKEEGKVIIRAFISKQAEVLNVTIISSSGHKRLDEAAMNAIKSWQFIPAKKANEPIASYVEVPFVFSLSK